MGAATAETGGEMKWHLGFLREPMASGFDEPRNKVNHRMKSDGPDQLTELGSRRPERGERVEGANYRPRPRLRPGRGIPSSHGPFSAEPGRARQRWLVGPHGIELGHRRCEAWLVELATAHGPTTRMGRTPPWATHFRRVFGPKYEENEILFCFFQKQYS
jgi:hypothetical protein